MHRQAEKAAQTIAAVTVQIVVFPARSVLRAPRFCPIMEAEAVSMPWINTSRNFWSLLPTLFVADTTRP